MTQPRSELDKFNPFAEHFFTSCSPPSGAVYATDVPLTSYPGHIVAASTSPAARSNLSQSPTSSMAASQSPRQSQSQASPQPIQSPQPRHRSQTTRGFSINSGVSTPSSDSCNHGTDQSSPQAVFESFRKDTLTPDVDDLPLSKRKTNAWGTKELEESVRSE